MGKLAEEARWHDVLLRKWTQDRSLGVLDLPRVHGGKPLWIKMHVVPGEVPCMLSKCWLKEQGVAIDTQADEVRLTLQQITALRV